ncbi:MAG: apolipoprotein N-acyltransferase, partial [Pseudomonadota bacterium]
MPRPGGVREVVRPAAAAVSGLLLVLAFPAADLGWLAWIALVPLLIAIDGQRPSQAFRLGYVTGAVFFGGLLEWVRLFGLPAWVLLTLLLAIFPGAFAAGVRLLVRERRPAALWIVPVTWVAVEVVRSVGPVGFPWGLLGLSQYRSAAMLAVASGVGAFGLSGLIALANTGLAILIVTRRVTAPVVAGLVVLAVPIVAGTQIHPAEVQLQRIVAAVQPNVPPMRKNEGDAVAGIVLGLMRQTEEARTQGAEIIVYPETAIPTDLGSLAYLRHMIARRAGGATVVAGTFLSGQRNGVLVVDPRGEIVGRYVKRRLVPFGEAGVQPGRSGQPVQTALGAIGIAICYESAFTFPIRHLVAEGASLIAILTNDGWFGTSSGPAQHAAHSVLRAAETGRPLVRAANTGVSMIIRPSGAVAGTLPLGAEGVLVAAVPVHPALTPYVLWGWLLGPLCAAVWIAAISPQALRVIEHRPAATVRLIAAAGIPAIPVIVGRWLALEDGLGAWLVWLAMFGAAVVVGRRHLTNRRGLLVSAPVSMAVTFMLILAMRSGYARYGYGVPLVAPLDGWLAGGALLLAAGIATEAWLRGAVFAAAESLGGWPLAVVLSTLLGVVLHLDAPQ